MTFTLFAIIAIILLIICVIIKMKKAKDKYEYIKSLAHYSNTYHAEYGKVHKEKWVKGCGYDSDVFSKMEHKLYNKDGCDFDYYLAKNIFTDNEEWRKAESLLNFDKIEKEYKEKLEIYIRAQNRRYAYKYEYYLLCIFTTDEYMSDEYKKNPCTRNIERSKFYHLIKRHFGDNDDEKTNKLIEQWYEKEIITLMYGNIYLGNTLTRYAHILSKKDSSLTKKECYLREYLKKENC